MATRIPLNRSAWLAAATALLLTRCDVQPWQARSHVASNLHSQQASRRQRIDDGLAAAVEFLASRQSTDGAWRSAVYAPFKAGDALTPLVLMTLLETSNAGENASATDKATRYLVSMLGKDGTVQPPEDGLAYPVYTAAAAVMVLSRQPDPDLRGARDAWLTYLRERQLTETLGWREGDAPYGGWGYASELPRKPPPDVPLAPLAEPNLSATVFALTALRSALIDANAPEVQKALGFVRRCQNFANDAAAAGDPALAGRPSDEERFDDGGFFFIQNDPVRNKAGVAGIDRVGRQRFASYGSATADGLRALILCGSPADEPRVAAAWNWLENHFSADTHPGEYSKQREAAREAVYFYYCHSLAQALFDSPSRSPQTQAKRMRWATALADALLGRQQPDGSWRNTAVDVREDDPLVATSLAASALALCRKVIKNESRCALAPTSHNRQVLGTTGRFGASLVREAKEPIAPGETREPAESTVANTLQ